MEIKKQRFNDFDVFSCDDCNSFIHINITNENLFYKNLFQYFFSEERLLKHIENKASVNFEPTKANYAALYKKMKIFIDKENLIDISPDLESEILQIIADEYTIVTDDETHKIRLDKIGKIGEYIFSVILSEFFGYQCIIPKLNMITDKNMSIFGIDVLFYAVESKMLLLGESKVSKSVKNGISLINKSLSTYQEQVDDEFELILSQRMLKDKRGSFNNDFGDLVEISLTMKEFIENASIDKIGIPIFIAHSGSNNVEDIFNQLKSIHRISLYGLDTVYLIISLPLIDKNKFMQSFAREIAERSAYYELCARQL